MTEPTHCSRCRGDVTRRSRPRLFAAGFVLCLLAPLAIPVPLLWLPAAVVFLTGGYLVYWATLGKGLWCRQCKVIPR